MPDYFHVETRTCGVFSSAGRALAKRRGKTRPVLNLIPVGEASAGGLLSLARFQELAAEAASAIAGYPHIARIAASSGRSPMPLSAPIASISPAGVPSNTGCHSTNPVTDSSRDVKELFIT